MENQWYYVADKERKGPISENEIYSLIESGVIENESYVWRQGFENWEKLKDVSELSSKEIFSSTNSVSMREGQGVSLTSSEKIDWSSINEMSDIFSIKIGIDRGGAEVEYGPYSLSLLKRLYRDKRISAKTLIFAVGMDNWEFLAETPIFERVSGESLPPSIDESDRRLNSRRPFVARILFHDSSNVYEGVCRDISVGGLQLLVNNFPGAIGESISLNVHPNNSKYNFTASGQVVRFLEGKKGICIRFTKLSSEAQEKIHQYVESGNIA